MAAFTAAITTMLNPLDKQSIMIFQSNKNYTLAVESRKIEDGDMGKLLGYGGVKPRSPAPALVSPSHITSFVYQNSTCVYGVIEDIDEDESLVLKVCLLSPLFDVIVPSGVENGIIAGCIDKRKSGWIYYHGKDGKTPKIFERGSSPSSDGGNPLEFTFTENTRLSAVFDGSTKWLAYQQADGEIGIYDATTLKNFTASGTKKFAAKQTSIAVCVVPADKESKREKARLYVYFVDSDKNLYRAWSNISDGVVFSGDSNVKRVGTAQFSPGSQLSVFADIERERNLIYAVKANSDKVSSVDDDWPTK